MAEAGQKIGAGAEQGFLGNKAGCFGIGAPGWRLMRQPPVGRRAHARPAQWFGSFRAPIIPAVTAPVSRPKTALIADDHLLVRSGVRLLLQSLGFEVQGEAGTASS